MKEEWGYKIRNSSCELRSRERLPRALLFICPLRKRGVLTNRGTRDASLASVSTTAEEAIHPIQVHCNKALLTELTNAMHSKFW
jgi:hypothetical protein